MESSEFQRSKVDTTKRIVRLPPDWLQHLAGEFDQPYMVSLREFLLSRLREGKTIYPPMPLLFNAFYQTRWDELKVVILGQDPYHGMGQAHGLSFSVPAGIRWPPSLRNIFQELMQDIGCRSPSSGDLTAWARQGVLLLNAVLTVEEGQPASHQGKGWETFTDRVIQMISEKKEHVVFILWGSYAQAKIALIDQAKHHIMASPHPSPFSAHRGFLGSRPFSRTNEVLKSWGMRPISWCLE